MKRLVLGALVALTLTGCGGKLTKTNYDKLESGMSYQQVTEILGKAESCSEALRTNSCIWGKEDKKYIKVTFFGDKATIFSAEGIN